MLTVIHVVSVVFHFKRNELLSDSNGISKCRFGFEFEIHLPTQSHPAPIASSSAMDFHGVQHPKIERDTNSLFKSKTWFAEAQRLQYDIVEPLLTWNSSGVWFQPRMLVKDTFPILFGEALFIMTFQSDRTSGAVKIVTVVFLANPSCFWSSEIGRRPFFWISKCAETFF